MILTGRSNHALLPMPAALSGWAKASVVGAAVMAELIVRAQSGALGGSSAHHRTRLRFRELSAGFLTAFATDFGQILSRFFVHAHTSRQFM